MTDEIEQLKLRLIELEEEIRETEKRVPAHSVKPQVMGELFILEDKKDLLLQTIKELQ